MKKYIFPFICMVLLLLSGCAVEDTKVLMEDEETYQLFHTAFIAEDKLLVVKRHVDDFALNKIEVIDVNSKKNTLIYEGAFFESYEIKCELLPDGIFYIGTETKAMLLDTSSYEFSVIALPKDSWTTQISSDGEAFFYVKGYALYKMNRRDASRELICVFPNEEGIHSVNNFSRLNEAGDKFLYMLVKENLNIDIFIADIDAKTFQKMETDRSVGFFMGEDALLVQDGFIAESPARLFVASSANGYIAEEKIDFAGYMLNVLYTHSNGALLEKADESQSVGYLLVRSLIYYNKETGEEETLTDGHINVCSAAVSPDQSRLAYIAWPVDEEHAKLFLTDFSIK